MTEAFQPLADSLGFTPQDSVYLRALHQRVEPHLPGLVDGFYASLARRPDTAAALDRHGPLTRLHAMLAGWLDELLLGPHDEAWHARRRQVGSVHFRLGLDQRAMVLAMGFVRRGLVDLTLTHGLADDPAATVGAIERVLDLELATLLESWNEADRLATEAEAAEARNLARMGAFAAAIAHEIRNPLAGISAAMQLVLLSLPADDRRRGVLTKLLDQVRRLDQHATDLLAFSQPLEARSASIDLGQVARLVASQVAAGDLGGAEVVGEGAALGDASLLGLALTQLIQNAWQAGARRVHVAIRDGAIAVYDDGPGIDPAIVARIYEPFYTTRQRGSGLGLTNALRAIQAMGGRLQLTDSPLGGAGFELTLQRATSTSASSSGRP